MTDTKANILPIPEQVKITEEIVENELQPEVITDKEETKKEELPHLRPKLIRLCENIIAGQTRIEAHKNAGFKAPTDNDRTKAMHRYLQNADIMRYIEIRTSQIQAKLAKETEVTREWIAKGYQGIITRCQLETNKDSVQWGRLERETYESVAKLHGLLIDNISITDKTLVVKELSALDDKDREKLRQRLGDKLRLITSKRSGSVRGDKPDETLKTGISTVSEVAEIESKTGTNE